MIVNLTSNPYLESGFFDAPGNGNGNSIFVQGNIGYMTSGNNFYTFGLSSKTGSRGQLGSVTLAGTGVRIFVVGTYAYVVISGSSPQLQIIDVSNPNNLAGKIVGQATVNGQNGVDVFVNSVGTRAYLITSASASRREMFILDVTTKTGNNNTPIGSYDTSGMNPKGITVVPNNKAVIIGTEAEEYQVVNISNESVPVRCGGLNIDSGINGVSSVLEADGDAYSYIITGDPASELKVIAGGPGGGGGYFSTGTYESKPFDSGYSTAFNRFVANISQPASTSVQMQVAVANQVSGSCLGANYTYVGPNGNTSAYFTSADNATIQGAIPFGSFSPNYINPGRCFRYKLFLSTTDATKTPIFNDITINYSP